MKFKIGDKVLIEGNENLGVKTITAIPYDNAHESTALGKDTRYISYTLDDEHIYFGWRLKHAKTIN